MNEINNWLNIWAAGIALCISSNAFASSDALLSRDINPLLTGFDLPRDLPAIIGNAGDSRFDGGVTIGNTSLNQRVGSEHLQVDAEVRRWQLTYSRTVSSQLKLQIELPYQTLVGGSLDGFIENFHRDFNLPNGNRALWPRNRLLITYNDANRPSFVLNKQDAGFGDLSFRAGWQLRNDSAASATLWTSIKLPTGDKESLASSGAVDLSLTLATQMNCTATLRCYQNLSLSRLGTADYFGFMQRHDVWSGSLGVDWYINPHWSVLAELHGHSAAYKTDMRLLGRSGQLSFGPRYESGGWQTTFSLTEDIAVDTAPDIQFQLNVGHNF